MNVDEAHVERRFSLYALITTVIVVGVLFFRVAQPFLLPLFLAAVLALLFRPVHEKCTDWLRGHRHLAAGLVTAAVFLLGLLPVCGALILAGRELFDAGQELLHLNWWQQPVVADVLKSVEPHLAEQDWNDWRRSAANAVEGVTKEVYARTQSLLANVAGFLIGLSVVGLGLFYFLAEGPTMMRTVQRLSPLNDEDETALVEEFARVCRGEVERFEVPNLLALNFILHDSLGGGGTESLKTDAQGKTHGQGLLAMEVEVPEHLLKGAGEDG